MDTRRHKLERHLAQQGLCLLGGFVPDSRDAVPGLPAGRCAAVVWMVSQAGSAVWPVFAASREAQDGLPDPMDRWSQSLGDALAHRLGGVALYPSDGPPWWPFQHWMARSAPVRPSPLMLQIHPQFGLWQACRFALVLPDLAPDDLQVGPEPQRPGTLSDLCLRCDGQPCLQACPVDAFAGQGLDVAACTDHLASAVGQECMARGCQARRACPVGVDYRYGPKQAAFHMAAFVGARLVGT